MFFQDKKKKTTNYDRREQEKRVREFEKKKARDYALSVKESRVFLFSGISGSTFIPSSDNLLCLSFFFFVIVKFSLFYS